MKQLIIVLLMIWLAGCNSVTRALVCQDVEKYSLGIHEMCSYSRVFNKCKCKQIDLDTYSDITKFSDYPLEHCDDLLGIKADTWGKEIGPNLKSLSRIKEERCQ